jgi:Bacterial self-protective colicin-like immunity
MENYLLEYINIIEKYLDKKSTVEIFQKTYFNKFLKETNTLLPSIFEILDGIFGDLDCFTDNPVLKKSKPSFYLTESELRVNVEQSLIRLKAIDESTFSSHLSPASQQ